MTMRRTIALLLAFGMLAAACGGGGDDASTATTEAAATTAASTSPAQTVFSADGYLNLKVPAGSPEVTITDITAADAGMDDVYSVLGAYDLGPDGTTFESPVVATFDTGMAHATDDPLPLLAVALENGAGEYEVLSTRVDVSDGTLRLTAQVTHFSRLVIVGGPDALTIWPEDIIAPVGSWWWADWSIYDARTQKLTNTAARLQYRRETWTDEEGFVRIQPLIDGIQIDPYAFATGVVVVEEDSSIGTYAYDPDWEEGGADGGIFSTYVEIFWGEALFACDVAGTGTYGFDVAVFLPPGSVAFAARLANGRTAVVVPSGGATITYAEEGEAFCVSTRYGTTTRLLSTVFNIRASKVETLLNGIREDGMHDGIWSIPGISPGLYLPHTDLWDSGAFRLRVSERILDPLINFSVFECGETVALDALDGAEVTTVCAADPQPIPEGDVVLALGVLSGPLSLDGDGSEYVYAAVFESNGDPSDDWQYQGDYEWDFFRDTDRWYQVLIHVDGSKEMVASDAIGPMLPSGARALLYEDTVLWVIPAGEFNGDALRARVSAFVHDGTFDPETGMGDVSGADPTEAPFEVVSLDE